jgi:hypothetical protein
MALRYGRRGLPGGEGLSRFLHRRLGAPTRASRTGLTVEQILAWADKHFERTGVWPNQKSGPVADAPGERWYDINSCLRRGFRGLPGGDTLARLLEEHRGVHRWTQQA